MRRIVQVFGLLVLSGALVANMEAANRFEKLHGVKEMKYKIHTKDQVLAFFQKQSKVVVTFVGYSGKGYENKARMFATAREFLKPFSKKHTLINIGVTPDGIGEVYDLAKSLGFETSGIV